MASPRSCYSPLRQERSASRKELCAQFRASSRRTIYRCPGIQKRSTADAVCALSLRAVGGWYLLLLVERCCASSCHVQNRGPRSSWSRAQRDGRWAAISPALQLAGASRCQGKQGDQQRAARRRACTSLRKPTLYYLRLDLSCTAHCCIIVHSF